MKAVISGDPFWVVGHSLPILFRSVCSLTASTVERGKTWLEGSVEASFASNPISEPEQILTYPNIDSPLEMSCDARTLFLSFSPPFSFLD